MTRIIENEIAVLIEQSNDIAKHVHQEDWDSVEQLTEKRQLALESFFNKPINKDCLRPVENMIRNILKIDNELVQFIENEKNNTFKKFAHLKSNSKANSAYQNVASLNFR